MRPTKFYIGKELFFCENEERFALILEEKLGIEAADCFREEIMGDVATRENLWKLCGGECDAVYKAQEARERALQDVKDSLCELDPQSMTKAQIAASIKRIIRDLIKAE